MGSVDAPYGHAIDAPYGHAIGKGGDGLRREGLMLIMIDDHAIFLEIAVGRG